MKCYLKQTSEPRGRSMSYFQTFNKCWHFQMLIRIFFDINWKDILILSSGSKLCMFYNRWPFQQFYVDMVMILIWKMEWLYRDIKPLVQTCLLERGISAFHKDKFTGTSSLAHELAKICDTCGTFIKAIIIFRVILRNISHFCTQLMGLLYDNCVILF